MFKNNEGEADKGGYSDSTDRGGDFEYRNNICEFLRSKNSVSTSSRKGAVRQEARLFASRKAVIQAQKRFTRIEQAFYERLEAENRGIREWEEKTVYEQGYKVDNAGIRRTVVIGESLIGGLIRQEQWVHRYDALYFVPK